MVGNIEASTEVHVEALHNPHFNCRISDSSSNSSPLPTSIMSSPYPNAYQIEEIFSSRDNPTIFNTYLADSVDVTVVGQDFHIAGQHQTPQAFHDAVWARMTAVLKLETLRIEVVRVIGGGESSWAAVESSATATSKSGE